MGKDPAFLFYPADASQDTQFMNRLERGAYFDLLKGQRMYGGYTVVQLRKILGNDFELVWPSLELVLEFHEERYFIGWLRLSLSKRDDYSKKQSDRVTKRWNNRGNTTVLPKIVNEIEIVNETVICIDKEKGVKKFETPTPNEISIYLLEKYPDGNFNGANLFAEKFWSFYENNGWKVGKNKMKSWKLAIASWSDTLQKDLFPANSANSKNLNNDYENSKLKRLTDQKEEGRLLIEKLYADKHSNQ